jgi:hypothetical protein
MAAEEQSADASGSWTYSESVAIGHYDTNLGGLFGKHDNVQTYWEDELTRSKGLGEAARESFAVQYSGHSIERFPLRFWTGNEVRELCRSVSVDTSVSVEPLELLDRSIFVGRHVDTAEYGTCLPPVRKLVNRLFEHNVHRLQDGRGSGHGLVAVLRVGSGRPPTPSESPRS